MSELASEPSGRPGPLDGIKVLDLSVALTGPYAAALLADQGAEVIKVERPGMGDIARWIGVSVNGMSSLYLMCNRGKRCIAVDLHTPEGADIVRRLAADADVFLQNFRPGVMVRLGLGYDDIRAINPDVVYASLSGFGSKGPYAGKSAYDTVIQAYGGLAHNQADPADGTPVFLRQTAADKITSLYAAQAVTAALLGRARGKGGQHLELAMLDAVTSFLWADSAGNESLLDSDGSMASSFVSTFKPFLFLDGWGVVTPTTADDFAGLCKALEVEGWDDPRISTVAERIKPENRPVMTAVMGRVYEVAATLSTEEAMRRFEAQRIPCGVVLSPAELVEDEHAVAVGMFEDGDHPIAGRTRIPRHPTQFGSTPARLGGPSPALGEHTDEILGELGLGGRITELRSTGVVA